MRSKCHSVRPQKEDAKEIKNERMEIDGCVEEKSDQQMVGEGAEEVKEEAGTVEGGVSQPEEEEGFYEIKEIQSSNSSRVSRISITYLLKTEFLQHHHRQH